MVSKDWYRNLKITDLDRYIQLIIRTNENRQAGIYYDMVIGSPDHGQAIDSQLYEEFYSAYWHAEIITQVTAHLKTVECRTYVHFYINKKKNILYMH